MKNVDGNAMSRMVRLLKIAASAASLDPNDVQRGQDSIGIVGTGVDVVWGKDALGRGKPGWQIRTTYHVSTLGAQSGRITTEIDGSFAPGEDFQIVRAAVMLILQRRVEAALSEAV